MTGSVIAVMVVLTGLWVCANAVAAVVALALAWKRRAR